MNDLHHFRFWCQKVLPLVYDNSLSYYEVLCKVVDYINNLIEQDKVIFDDIAGLRADMTVVQEWIANFDNTEFLSKLIENCLLTMILVTINNDGYIVYYIPESWHDITFNTTDLDIFIPNVDYGHLTLSY